MATTMLMIFIDMYDLQAVLESSRSTSRFVRTTLLTLENKYLLISKKQKTKLNY